MGSYRSKAREGRFRAARSDDSKKALRWFRVCFYCFWVFFGGLFFFFFLFIFESFFCGQKLYQSRLQHARRPFRHVETREWTWKGFEGAWMERGMSLDHEIWFWATVSIFSLWAFYSFDRLWWWDGGPGKEAELTKWTKRRSKTILWSFWAALMSLLWKHV